MREIRIYLEPPLRAGDDIELDARASGHLVRVLRRRTGDRFTAFDGLGHEAEAELTEASRRGACRARIGPLRDVSRESPLRIELIQAVARGDKMDDVVRKAVELGVATIRPVLSTRTEVRMDADGGRKLERWREIMLAACEQSGRTMVPELHPPATLDRLTPDADLRLMLDPGACQGLGELPDAADASGIAVAIGPEGGFDDTDLRALAAMDFRPVRFGPRVLRTETAGPAVIAALQCLYGDLGAV